MSATRGADAAPAKVERFIELSRRAQHGGSRSLSDEELLEFLDLQRWAVGQISDPKTRSRERGLLTAAAFDAHAVLHRRRARVVPLGRSLRRVAGSFALSLVLFLAAGVLAFLVVRAEPTLAYNIVPREVLAQISPSHWGQRGGVSDDLGATFFYWGNNLRAAFLSLALGALLGVMALVPLTLNAALLGAVAAASVQRGALPALLSWIAPHGVPELGGLILCSAIGLDLGRGWLYPGRLSRRQSAAAAGRELSPVMMAAAAMVICAAPLEGFVAPLSLPAWLDAGIALSWVVLLSTICALALRLDPPPARQP